MSDMDPTDLICKARRQPLTELEARRLEELVATNLEARLMYLMLPEFERAGRVQRGDDALAARIAERALSRTKTGRVVRLPKHGWLLAAAILMGVTAAAGAWWTVRPMYRDALLEPRNLAPPISQTPTKGKPTRLRSPRPSPDANPTETTTETQVEAAPTTPDPSAVPDPQVAAPLRRTPTAVRPTAAELFSKANLLRRDRQNAQALQLYRTILDGYGNSREAPLARLALAKSLSADKPQEALPHYQELARSCQSLRAEALWGIAETAALTGQKALRQQALADLLQEFPESPYAAVARQGTSDAAK